MSEPNELDTLRRQVAELSDEVARLKDAQAIRRVQFSYGYYMDKGCYQEIVDLFADDGEVRFMGGVFRGKDRGVKRLYIDRFRATFTRGKNGPVYGFLLDHMQLQDIVDVAADRRTAYGRFRCFLQGGSHVSKTDPVAALPQQWWEAGVYENTYVRTGDVWKIKVLNYCLSWQADYERGWAHSEPYEGPFFTKAYPQDPGGPDEITAERPAFWPDTALIPFHFPHPVTGKRST
ncbi:MAG TPA: nuclear transport factor 2 family protein [Steroidobacteraceae bacterium]|nr:nuclear transport factor 2 family protein [Steroidobacteraceae bacterium]